jgi:hypothetical protein
MSLDGFQNSIANESGGVQNLDTNQFALIDARYQRMVDRGCKPAMAYGETLIFGPAASSMLMPPAEGDFSHVFDSDTDD